jgi:hypothetical protein
MRPRDYEFISNSIQNAQTIHDLERLNFATGTQVDIRGSGISGRSWRTTELVDSKFVKGAVRMKGSSTAGNHRFDTMTNYQIFSWTLDFGCFSFQLKTQLNKLHWQTFDLPIVDRHRENQRATELIFRHKRFLKNVDDWRRR